MSDDNDEGYLVHAPPNEVAKAEAVYAIVSVDDKGEGVCGMMMDEGGWVPAVFIHPRLIEPAFAAFARAAGATGKHQKLRLLKFSQREVLREIDT